MTRVGIYEKALPKDISWLERLQLAKKLEFDYVEMSVDETDERLARLDWTNEERHLVKRAMEDTGVMIHSMCFSGQRRYPMGSHELEVRTKSLNLMFKAIDLAYDLGIRIIQVAGYDVYYEDKDILTRHYFIENLRKSLDYAASKGVILSIEIMDDPFMNSISRFLDIKEEIASPYLQVYPDLGNLSAWGENNVGDELKLGIPYISAIHLKDTYSVTPEFPGQFRDVPFGEGCVDFEGCLKTLKRLGYSGPFMIEMWSEKAENPEIEIAKAKNYLYPLIEGAGYDV